MPAPSGYLRGSQLQPSAGRPIPEAHASAPSAPLAAGRRQHLSCFSVGKYRSAQSPWWIFCFAFRAHVSLCSALRFPWPRLWGGFLCVESSSPRVSLPQGAVTHPKIVRLPFPYLTPMKLIRLSGSLRSSASIQKTFCGSCSVCRWFLKVFVREKVFSHPIPLPLWRSSETDALETLTGPLNLTALLLV